MNINSMCMHGLKTISDKQQSNISNIRNRFSQIEIPANLFTMSSWVSYKEKNFSFYCDILQKVNTKVFKVSFNQCWTHIEFTRWKYGRIVEYSFYVWYGRELSLCCEQPIASFNVRLYNSEEKQHLFVITVNFIST